MPRAETTSAKCRQYRRLGRISRRGFVQAGVLAGVGLQLADYLRMSARADDVGSAKAKNAILVWLGGGLTHHDTFDPKADAVAEVRGEYSTIETSVAGVRFADSIPGLAAQMHRMTLIRSVTHPQSAHDAGTAYMQSAYAYRPGHNFPSIGSVIGFERRGIDNGLPPYIAVPQGGIGAGHLGASYNAFAVGRNPNEPKFQVRDLEASKAYVAGRLKRRRRLLADVNEEFRRASASLSR